MKPPSTAASPAGPSSRWLAPALLTPLAFAIHGFHPFANDAALYTAGIRHILHPSLYPLNALFVTAFSRYSILPWTIAGLVRLLHLPLAWILLFLQLVSICLFLYACLSVADRIWTAPSARWPVALLAAACFTLPVAGTALSLMDPYVTPRSFSAPLALLAVAASLRRRWLPAAALLLPAVLIHPLMGLYATAFVVLCGTLTARRLRLALALCLAALLAAGIAFAAAHGTPVNPAYRQALSLAPRSFLFLARWHWYEVLGLILPLALFSIGAIRSPARSPARGLCLACLLLGATALLIAALFVPPGGPYPLVPLQVLRSFHLIYAIGVILCGGLLARLLRRSPASALALLALLMAGMFAAQRSAWSGCRPVEWPGQAPINPWQQAFLWIRANTPPRAVFAFDPKLVYLPEEDEQGFRAIAQRDSLADDKDAGIAAVLPSLAPRWALQRNAELGIGRMSDAQRAAALIPLGANWLLLPPQARTALPCPWSNRVARICKMAP